AFSQHKNQPNTILQKQIDLKIEPLTHNQTKPHAKKQLNNITINPNKPDLRFTNIKPEHNRHNNVDNPQTNTPTTLNLHHL
uniref:hypothetical protein n=1 Tax=Klebsiella pneumoniae TaxID=573 RepID=UPI0019516CF5